MFHYMKDKRFVIYYFIIGLGIECVYSDNRVPNPPANITTFIIFSLRVFDNSEFD